MNAVILVLIKFAQSSIGEALIAWLGPKLWALLSKKSKDIISKDHLKDHIKATLAEYDKASDEARAMGVDGYTPEEIEIIRKKKTELEERLMNESKS